MTDAMNDASSNRARAANRPVSPHLEIYRPQITWVLSITHRLMGIALAVGSVLLVYLLSSLATGPEAFATAKGFFGNPLIIVLLLGWTFAFFFHLLNGIRHLVWDAGKGFEIETVTKTGIGVVVGAAALTLIIFITALMKGL